MRHLLHLLITITIAYHFLLLTHVSYM